MAIFERAFQAGWASMDLNGHMGNTSYLDYSVDTRMAYFAEAGFPNIEFQRLQFGPVVKNDYVEYYREIRLMDKFTVRFEASGLAENASRFRIVNSFFLEDGRPAAKLTSVGGWLSFKERKLIVPPDGVREALHNLLRTDDFEVFEPSVS